MARARNIKPAIFRNEVLGVSDPLHTLLFQSLWLLADREGRLEDRPIRIKADTFPYREGIDIDAMLTWLHDNGFIIRYDSRNYASASGKNASHSRFIQIVNFLKHQNPHRNEAESIIPAYSSDCENSRKNPSDSRNYASASEEIGSAPADSLNLIPDSGILIPDPLSSSPDFKSEDDEYFASLAEQEQKRQAEADARVKVEMTPDWQPNLKVLDDHLRFLGTKVLVSGRKVTSADLTDEIISDFRSAGHRKQERRTNHDWHGGLANYLIARIKNPKPETPKNSLPGGQSGTGEPPRHRLAFTDEKDRPKYGTYALMKPEPVKIANDPNDPVWIARQAQLRSMIK